MNKLIATRLDVRKDDLNALKGKKFKEHTDLVYLANIIDLTLRKIAQNHFGVFETMISESLLTKVKLEINKKYLSFSAEELEYCYDRSVKRQNVVVLTFEDWIKPISDFFPIKNAINQASNVLLEEFSKEAEAEQKTKEFLEESLKLYRECFKNGEWIGTVFHSIALAKSYLKDKLPEDLKQSYFDSAKLEEIENKKIVEKFPNKATDFFGFTWQRIAAKKYVSECINQKIEI